MLNGRSIISFLFKKEAEVGEVNEGDFKNNILVKKFD